MSSSGHRKHGKTAKAPAGTVETSSGSVQCSLNDPVRLGTDGNERSGCVFFSWTTTGGLKKVKGHP